jgi:hypothetical protein
LVKDGGLFTERPLHKLKPMEDQLRSLVEKCTKSGDRNPLWPDGHIAFCSLHGITADRFCYLFAKLVAEEFAQGEISYADGDAAMNCLFGVAVNDLSGFAVEIFQAFDAGEYRRQDDPVGTIPWQKYTLPYVMEALVKEGLLPR